MLYQLSYTPTTDDILSHNIGVGPAHPRAMCGAGGLCVLTIAPPAIGAFGA